jgi:site-specific DNA-methyltransferase (adenine-specific)
MIDGKPYKIVTNSKSTNYGLNKAMTIKNNGSRYPVSILRAIAERGLHPTQKPLALCKYLIKTYTQEGDVVLDNCMGSGTVGVAAVQLKRQFIGMESDAEYFDIAKKRVEEAYAKSH